MILLSAHTHYFEKSKLFLKYIFFIYNLMQFQKQSFLKITSDYQILDNYSSYLVINILGLD